MARLSSHRRGFVLLLVVVGCLIGAGAGLYVPRAEAEEAGGYKCSQGNNGCTAGGWRYCWVECGLFGCTCDVYTP
jgi:hypothetical protein